MIFLKIVFVSVVSLALLTGCGSSNNNDILDVTRFTNITIDGEVVEVDNTKNLGWIGSSGKNQDACQPHKAATTEFSDVSSAKEHCSQLVFAGHEDWRVATPIEHQEYILAMEGVEKVPYYISTACKRVIGVDGNDTAKAIHTHNSDSIGSMMLWSDLINEVSSSYGVKCVRDTK